MKSHYVYISIVYNVWVCGGVKHILHILRNSYIFTYSSKSFTSIEPNGIQAHKCRRTNISSHLKCKKAKNLFIFIDIMYSKKREREEKVSSLQYLAQVPS